VDVFSSILILAIARVITRAWLTILQGAEGFQKAMPLAVRFNSSVGPVHCACVG